MKKKIEIQRVCKSFQHTQVLCNIGFDMKAGEIFGLLGASGAGKTTIIKILTGQLLADSGKVMIFGKDSTKASQDIYESFGVVLDNPGLYERLSCYDNLHLFTEIYGVEKVEIDKVLRRVGLWEEKRKPVGKLSKGMKQRLVLARSVIHRPQILLLDEPTGALDPRSARQIHTLIEEQRKQGTAILLTTHSMEEASKLCDQVALLDQGEIIEYGVPDDICRKYNHLNQIKILLKNGDVVELPNNKGAADKISHLFREEQIDTIHSSEPSLESVFIKLTGKNLEV